MTETTTPAPAANKVPGFSHKLGHLTETVFSCYGLFALLLFAAMDIGLDALIPGRNIFESPLRMAVGGLIGVGIAVGATAIPSCRRWLILFTEFLTLFSLAEIVQAAVAFGVGGVHGFTLDRMPAGIIAGALLALSITVYAVSLRDTSETEEARA